MSINEAAVTKKTFEIPMVVTKEVIRDFGLDSTKVAKRLIGNRWRYCIMVPASEKVYRAYVNAVDTARKQDDRSGRCMVMGKRGKLIRCPESNSCKGCPQALLVTREENKPVSIDTVENQINFSGMEDSIIDKILLEQLIDRVSELSPQHSEIFRLLLDGMSQQDIGEEVGLKQRTVSNRIKDIRKLLTPVVKELLNR
ncbi:MAG: sigma-70 family RNA polymerase sigma factor [Selenomonas sp.]|nr:sigma-70 family RNA polymerase sigma factor [Selenomonas sp.]